jgi:hypothetical protein
MAADTLLAQTKEAGTVADSAHPVLLRDQWRTAGFVSESQTLHSADEVRAC